MPESKTNKLDKRVLFFQVEAIAPDGSVQMKELNGLSIKGRISRKMGTSQAEATLSIANLDSTTVEYITTYTTPYFKPKTKKKISVFAGYERTGWGRIFTGEIESAIPTGAPDLWVNIKAKSLSHMNRTPITYGVSNITSKELAQSISNQLGLSFEWQATSQKKISAFDFTGSKAGLLKEFNRLEDVTMFEDNGVIKVVDKVAKPPENNIRLISQDTGMIGEPEPTEYGIKVKYLLDPSSNCGDWIETKSIKLPGTDGKYQIYALDFDFANREQQFYCEAQCKAVGVNVK